MKVSTAPGTKCKSSQPKFCWFCFLLVRTYGLRRLPANKVSRQVAKLDQVEAAQATNRHISTRVKQLFLACLQSSPSNHEEELTPVLTQHVSPKSAYTGLPRAGFCLRRSCYDTTIAWDVKGFFLELLRWCQTAPSQQPSAASLLHEHISTDKSTSLCMQQLSLLVGSWLEHSRTGRSHLPT